MTQPWLEGRRREALRLMECLPFPSFRKGLTISFDAKDILTSLQEKSSHPGSPANETSLDHPFVRERLFSLIRPKDRILARHIAKAIVQAIIIGKDDGPFALKTEESTHYLFHVREGVRTTIIISSGHAPSLLTTGIELFLDTGAEVDLIHVHESPSSFAFLESRISERASLNITDLFAGGKAALLRSCVDLAGKGSMCNHAVLLAPGKGEQVDSEIATVHSAPATGSMLVVRGAVEGKGIVQGSIRIKDAARESFAFQDMEILLFGASAEGDAIPILAIDTPEVRCNHAVKVGAMDESHLFYLQARGVLREDARLLLIQGFFDKHLAKLPVACRTVFIEKIRKVIAASSP